MKVLVIAPHPDDEIIGVGGTIAKRVKSGDSVYVCIVTKGIPPLFDSKFIEQTDRAAFEELIQASSLPYFTTDIAINDYIMPKDRVPIPILDSEVNVTFLLFLKKVKSRSFPNC